MNRMHSSGSVLCLLVPALLSTGCITNDFKVVDALYPGMTRAEADGVVPKPFRLEQLLGVVRSLAPR